jgi:predicted nucleic-acid-binding protein
VIALDTNVLARLLLQDDAAQFKRVKALLASGQEFTAPITVFLELVWVLEANDCSAQEIQRGLDLLLGLPKFSTPHAAALRQSLAHYAQGMDFADALHLCQSQTADALMTFDKAFAKKAGKTASAPPVRLV